MPADHLSSDSHTLQSRSDGLPQKHVGTQGLLTVESVGPGTGNPCSPDRATRLANPAEPSTRQDARELASGSPPSSCLRICPARMTRNGDFQSLGVNVFPAQANELRPSQAGAACQHHHCLIPRVQLIQESGKLRRVQDILLAESLGRRAHCQNGIVLDPFVTDRVREDRGEDGWAMSSFTVSGERTPELILTRRARTAFSA